MRNQIKPGDLVSFDLKSYSGGNLGLFVSYLANSPYSNDETLYEIKDEEFGVVISIEGGYNQKSMVLWSLSKRILCVDSKRVNHICSISP